MTRVVRFIILLLRPKHSFVSAIQRMSCDIKRNTWLLAYSLRNVTLHFETKALARDRAIVLSSDRPSSMTTARFTVSLSFFFFILQSRRLILFSGTRPEHSRIISSSLAPFVNSTMAPHNERRRSASQRLNSTIGQYYDYMVN